MSPTEVVQCPLSRRPMADAVLAPDGYIYSEAALQKWFLQHDYTSPITGEKMRAFTFRHFPMQSLAREVQTAQTADKPLGAFTDDPPDFVCCPITHDVMTDPVCAGDGHVYERCELQQWFESGRQTSPITNEPISHEVRSDLTMRAISSAWL